MDENVTRLMEAAAGDDAGPHERLLARGYQPKLIECRQLRFGGSAKPDTRNG